MPSRTSGVSRSVLFRFALITAMVPACPSPLRAADFSAAWESAAALEATVPSLPVELLPAVRFQRVYFRLSGSAAQLSDCAAEFKKLTAVTGEDPVSRTIADLSRLWLARIRMDEIDSILRGYYRKHVRFPESLDAIKQEIPAALQVDPWGEAWAYSPKAPKGFEHLAGQRYQLGPKRFPDTLTLASALMEQSRPNWQATVARSGNHRALSLRSAGAATAVIEPGGTFEGCTLLFAGENWALIATPDRLVALQL